MVKSTQDRSAIGKRSKRKGKTYERRCAKLLTEHTGVNFRSTPSSGGFNKFGGVKIREELFCGDLICDNPNFKFCVEAKNRKSFTFESILKNASTAEFTKWWFQCIEDAKAVKLLPILFFKPDNQADFIALDDVGFNKCKLPRTVPSMMINAYDKEMELKISDGKTKLEVTTKLPNPIIINWKDFIEYSNPSDLF